jgi:hypothetical protein
MDAGNRSYIQQRAGNRCEYCHIPQAAVPFIPFHVEHVVARQHMVDDSDANLALACHRCNAYKGPNLSSIDPDTKQITALFHPRNDVWTDHFQLRGAVIIPLTAIGRVTVRLLCFNDRYRLELREAWGS